MAKPATIVNVPRGDSAAGWIAFGKVCVTAVVVIGIIALVVIFAVTAIIVTGFVTASVIIARVANDRSEARGALLLWRARNPNATEIPSARDALAAYRLLRPRPSAIAAVGDILGKVIKR